MSRRAQAAGAGAQGGVPLLARIGEVKFRNPVFPGETVELTAKIKETVGGFTMMSGSIRSGEKRVLTVDFAVAWKTPGGAA
jgi:3-hydroxyacyl-[acyl-carrier-protein] dehydratase